MSTNPFILIPYKEKELFCDRKNELNNLVAMVQNNENITLISPRRYGKTGLIYRLFDEIETQGLNIATYYIDIFSSQNLDGFIKLLTEALTKSLEKEPLIKRFFSSLGNLRPLISYDPITGTPEITLTWRSQQEQQLTLKNILEYLDQQGRPVILAIDEFQQVREYEDCNMEALLRTYIQPLKNVHFIFCGSKKHVMIDMFSNAKKPFYESTSILFLDKIETTLYIEFIRKIFNDNKRTIDEEVVQWIVTWTYRHTYYTQYLCHRIFMLPQKHITLEDAYSTALAILKEQETSFLEIRSLLTPGQWNYLKAIAKEENLTQPLASSFLSKYKIPTASGAKRALTALIDKELILVNNTLEGKSYRLYNVFLSRWMERFL